MEIAVFIPGGAIENSPAGNLEQQMIACKHLQLYCCLSDHSPVTSVGWIQHKLGPGKTRR